MKDPMRAHAPHRFVRRSLSLAVSAGLLLSAPSLYSQQEEIEEVVVTGSFIRNSSFTGASPVDTLTAQAVENSGTINIGEFIRDLPYTANIDAVSNVLGGPGGGQDGNSAGFNLRGLGASSTLTLLDGSRVVNQGEVAALLPGIALERMEIVLDGGAALYGADAVAGVVNIIPIKEYDGVKMRSFYARDDGGDYEEYELSGLYGSSWRDFNWVMALELSKNTPLKRGERPKYLAMDNDLFEDGPGGTFRTLSDSTALVDPSCGTFNQGNDVKGLNGAFPSGRPTTASGGRCIFNYGQWIQYNRPSEEINFWSNLNWQPSDWLELELQVGLNNRLSTFITEPISPIATGWKPSVIMPANHPANPWGEDVIPLALRLFSGYGQGPGTNPFFVRDGSAHDDTTIFTDRTKFSANYDLGSTTWSGTTSLTYQTRRSRYESWEPQASRLLAGLNGMGGPSGNEWYNPLLSSDPRSPNYVSGVTNNSQEVVDWLFARTDFTTSRQRLMTFDSYLTGELLENWEGPVQLAIGVAARKFTASNHWKWLHQTGNDVSSSVGSPGRPLPTDTLDEQYVRSAFLELEIPILENLSAQVAARYEKFEEINLPTATPKVALRYQPLESLALRASWGEGFLAPDPTQIGPLECRSFTTERDGSDPITGTTLLGVESCVSSNPNLKEEESEIINFGFTWEPLDDLSLSLDYQVIKYDGRIVSPDSIDLVLDQFQLMLNAIGSTPGNYDPTPGSPTREAANAWLAANPNSLIQRDENQLPTLFIEVPENVESVSVKVADISASYGWDMANIGSFAASFKASYISEYIFDALDGSFVAVGFQNGQTAKAPPLPEWRTVSNLTWFRDRHQLNASLITNSDLIFNDTAPITPFRPGLPETDVERPTKVSGSVQLDLNYDYQMDDLFGFGQNVLIGVNMNNVFDWEPDALPIPGGLETRLYDPFGRTLSVSLDIEL